MKILDIKRTDEQIIYKVEVDQADWKKKLDDVKKGLLKSIKVDGFRPGKVPAEIAEKHLDKGLMINRAFSKIIDDQLKLLEETKEYKNEDAEVYTEVDLGVDEISLDKLVIEFKYWKFPVVSVKDYNKLEIDQLDDKVTVEEVKKEIDSFMKASKKVEPKESGKLENGDIAIFDFTGFKDGEKFSGGEAKNYELEIGSNQFIPGFEEQMVGMKLNETRTLKLKFPEDYHTKDLAGKDVEFEVTLNGMKSVKVPEYNDEYVKTLKLPEINTTKQLEKYVSDILAKTKKQQYLEKTTGKIYDAVYNNTTISHIPEPILQKEYDSTYKNYENQLKQKGLKLADYLKYINKSQEQFDAEFRKDVEKSFVIGLALEKIAELEKIKVEEKDIMKYIEDMCKVYGGDPKEIRQKIGDNTSHIVSTLLNQQVLDKLIELNTKKAK